MPEAVRIVIELVAVGLAVAGFVGRSIERRERRNVERELRSVREAMDRPDLVFDGIRASAPHYSTNGKEIAGRKMVGSTKLRNAGRVKAALTRIRHRVRLGGNELTPRNKNPDPTFLPPDKVAAFSWDLALPTGWDPDAEDQRLTVSLDVAYMGIGDRTYRYRGRYEYSANDDAFVATREEDLPG